MNIKKIFCKHDYVPWANTHGDWINWTNFRTVMMCTKCGKRNYLKNYIPAPCDYGAVMNWVLCARYDEIELADSLFGKDIVKDKELFSMLFGGESSEV